MKKHLVALLAVLMLLMAAIPMQALAASTGITTIYTSSTQTIQQGSIGKITLSIAAEKDLERVAYKFIDGSGAVAVGPKYSSSHDKSEGATRSYTIYIDTSSMAVGTYTAEYWIEYYSTNNWYPAAKVNTFSFEVIKNTCSGDHDLKQTAIHQETTCKEPGIAIDSCKDCDYVTYREIPMAHVYDKGKCTKAPTTTLVGEWTYTCKVCGGTKIETIDTSEAIHIVTQPKNAGAYDGEKATVSVKATGKSLKYVWQYSTDGGTTWKDTDADTGRSATYSLKMTSARDNRKVRCKITNKYNSVVYTNKVTLDTKFKAKITTQPKNAKAFKDKKATTTIVATGDGLKYQWYYKNPGSSSYSKSSITTAKCSVTMNATRDGRKMYCIVTDKHGNTAKSNTITLTMQKPVKITTQPKNASVFSGETAKFTVKATGDGLKYQWYYQNAGSSTWKKASSTSASYSLKNSADRNGRKFYCEITDAYGNKAKSDTVKMTVPKPKITTHPKSVTNSAGETAKFTVKATGEGLKYQWYYQNAGSSSWKKASSTSASYSLKNSVDRNGRKFYCEVTDAYGNKAKSDTATMKLPKVKITVQPENVSTTAGKTAKYAVNATGDGLKYQWYYKNPGSSSYKKGGTAKAYAFETTKSLNGRKIYCKITDAYGNSVETNKVTLKVY